MVDTSQKTGTSNLTLSGRPSTSSSAASNSKKKSRTKLKYVRKVTPIRGSSTKSPYVNALTRAKTSDTARGLGGRPSTGSKNSISLPSSVKSVQAQQSGKKSDLYIDPNTGAKARFYEDSPFVTSGQYVLASSLTPQAEASDVPNALTGEITTTTTEDAYTPPEQTLEDRAKSLLEGEQQDLYELGESIFGEELNPEVSSIEALVDELTTAQAEELAYAQESLTTQASLTGRATDELKAASASQQSAVDAALGVSREGATSTGNLMSAGKLKEAINKRYQDAITSLNSAQADREEALKNLEEAQREGRSEFVQQYQDALNNAEYEIQQAETDYINALVAQQTSDLEMQASIRANWSTFQDLISTGTVLNTDSLLSIASSLNLPFESVYGYYQGAEAIREDNSLSLQEKQLGLQQLQYEFDQELAGISTEEARNVDNYMKLVQSGQYSAEELSAFAVSMGIPSENNPVYQAELAVAQAEAKIKQAQASGELVGPMDQLAYAQALSDYYTTLGQTTGVLPSGGGTPETTAYQTETGIQFGFANGTSISSASRSLDQCGEFVNDVLGLSMGDSYSSKYAYVDPNIVMPEPGMAFVMPVDGDYADNGHTGIVEYYNPATQMVGVADVNGYGDGLAYHREIPLAKILDGGGFVPVTGTKLDENYSSLYSQYDEEDQYLMSSLANSAGGSRVLGDDLKSLTKSFQAVDQLEYLSTLMELDELKLEDGSVVDLSPLTGWLESKNPWDADAQTINAVLTGTIPLIARGIFGEVGVLTDADVELYKKTLPNLTQTDDVKKLVLSTLLTTVKNGVKNHLEVLANTGYDVSGLSTKYIALKNKIDELNAEIGITNEPEIEENPFTYIDIETGEDFLNSLGGTTTPPAASASSSILSTISGIKNR